MSEGPGRGGGKADASDLKSDNLKRLCGFDSHPRHHHRWFEEVIYWHEYDYEYDDEYDDEGPWDYGYTGDAIW